MRGMPWWAYALLAAGSAGLSLVLTPVARRVAVRLKTFDHPGGYKQQQTAVPYLGGVAIVAAFAAAVVVAVVVVPDLAAFEPAVVLGLGLAVALVGLVDDLRSLSPWSRLVFQTAAASGVAAVGVRVALVGVGPLDLVLTVVWIVGVTNAFNLLDNMDGLSAGVAAIASGAFLVIAAVNGQFLVASLAAALAGVAAGFLWHNFHPATIYMGDAGSLFFGFVLAVLGIKLRFEGPMEVTFLVPVLVLGIALFDTALVTITRIGAGRSPLSGGRDHLSHRLVALGFSVPAAVRTIYGAAIGLAWLALVMSRVDRVSGILLMVLMAAVAVVTGIGLARVGVADPPVADPVGVEERRP